MSAPQVLNELVAFSRRLGDETRDYVILGEGNTSARVNNEAFYVKASGTQLGSIDADGFVEVRFEPVLAMLEAGELSDDEIRDRLAAACPAPGERRPSVETVLHALLLQLPEVRFIGHTHPTALNMILCAQNARAAVSGRLFPDEIVVCGPAPVFVDYTDPGLPLARAVAAGVANFRQEHGVVPKAVLMQNHGLIAIGRTATEAENITAMWVKTARVLLGTYALGGPHYLSPDNVARLYTRPDEKYREQLLKEGQS